MKQFIKKLFASLDNHSLGFSGRKLTALFCVLYGAYLSKDLEFDPETDIENVPEDETCAICMEQLRKYPSVKLACRHYFHEECVKTWLIRKAKCPFCNIDVRRDL